MHTDEVFACTGIPCSHESVQYPFGSSVSAMNDRPRAGRRRVA